jgi:hypothetical protein
MSSGPRITVVTHGHCFDGLCSAVVFTRFMRSIYGEGAQLKYFGAGYGPGPSGVDPARFDGEQNAILDFRFSPSDKLTWYFDHHVSAFPSAEDRAAYDAHVASHQGTDRHMFHDGTYPSCTKYVRDIGKSVFGFEAPELDEMVRWADLIDAAAFPSAEMAVARKEPALQLMTVVEHHGDDAFLARMVPRLLERPLEEIALSDDVQRAFAPLQKGHLDFIELVRQKAELRDDVVVVDLGDRDLEVASKFVTYALFPDKRYSIVLTRSPKRCKLSIGYNPWAPRPRSHHIASICERYGGGGHPAVGAVNLAGDQLDRARQVMNEIASELSKP